jgi:ADP-heptose:LPS heptosyltransferase
VDPATEGEIRTRLRWLEVSDDERLFGIAPGAMWETKRWPLDRFAQLANRATQAGHRVILIGGPGDQQLGQTLHAMIPSAVDLTGKIPLMLLPALLARCHRFVGNDSGPMHIARAVGTPTVALFGSTDPAQFDFSGHAVLAPKDLDCAPCSFYGLSRCPRGHLRCLMDTSVEQVWSATESLQDP